MVEYDELCLYAGDDVKITDKIIITQPTLEQIRLFGEKHYFNAVQTLTSVGADLKWQLWDKGIDYTKIDDYDLFVRYIYQAVSSKKRIYAELTNNREKYADILSKISKEELEEMNLNPLELIFKDLDFGDFIPYKRKLGENDTEIVLYNPDKDILIDRVVYRQIVEAVRKIHGFKRNNETPANEQTKIDLIDDARDAYEMAKTKPYKSVLLPLVSTLKVKSSQCGLNTIWNEKIFEFFYDVKRTGKIQEAQMLLQGAYSGFASLKGIDRDKYDMFSEIK